MLKASHYFNGAIHFELREGLKLVINHNIMTDIPIHASFVDLIVLQGHDHELFRIGAVLDVDDLTKNVDMLCNTLKNYIKGYADAYRAGLRDNVLKDLIRTLVVYPDVFKTSSILYRQLQNTIFSLIGEEVYHYVTVFDAVYDDESGDHIINKYTKYRAGYDLFVLYETLDEDGEVEYWNGEEDNEEDYDYDDVIEEEVIEEMSEEEIIMEQENKRTTPLQEDEKAALLCGIDETTTWQLDRIKSMENYDFTVFPFGIHFFEKDEENNTTKALHYQPKTKEEVLKLFLWHLDLVNEIDKFDVGVIDREVYSDNIKEMEEFIENSTLEEILNPVGRYFFVAQLRNILVADFHMWQEPDGTWNCENDKED